MGPIGKVIPEAHTTTALKAHPSGPEPIATFIAARQFDKIERIDESITH
jgi:hypothetical protein